MSPVNSRNRRLIPRVSAWAAACLLPLGLNLGGCGPTVSGPAPLGSGHERGTATSFPAATSVAVAGEPERRGEGSSAPWYFPRLEAGQGELSPEQVSGAAAGQPAPEPGDATAGAPLSASGTGSTAEASGTAAEPCAGIARRRDREVVVDGQPVFFFGLNAPYLLDPEFPEAEVDRLLAEVSARGVNSLRVWFFAHHDPDRFARLLDAGSRHGIRFVVTLGDNVFVGRDWFFGQQDEAVYRPHLERTVGRFAPRSEILFWEVMNEPNCGEGRYEAACLKTIGDWLNMSTAMVRAIDDCHMVATGMIGAGNYEADVELYRKVHSKPAVEIVSVHRWVTDEGDEELDLAKELNRPVFYGEVYEKAYDDGCGTLKGSQSPRNRAERVVEDIEDAIQVGVDGYLLWDLAAGRIQLTDGGSRYYCSSLGYPLDDPLWPALTERGLPPPVPWR